MKCLILIFCLLLPALLAAQDICDYDKLLREGKAFAKQRQYKNALYKFNSARRCDRDKGEEVDAAIADLLDQVEGEKKAADVEREEAEKQRKIAEGEKQRAEEQTKKAEVAYNEVVKANEDCKVRLLLAEVERSQSALNFDVAVDKIKTAKTLGALPDSVDAAYQSLNRSILIHAREDLRRKEYKPALAKVKNAEALNVQPDSVAAISLALQQFLFENARVDILNTGYDNALEKINALRTLHVPMDTIESLWFEIAFCYTETGRVDRAAAALDTLAQMRHDSTIHDLLLEVARNEPAQQVQLLRRARQQLDPERNKSLTTRYLPPVDGKIPAGTITLGGCQVTVKPFLLATKEVTFFEYDLFCAATNRPKPDDTGWGREQRPVINISWYDAVEYCNWRSRQQGLQEAYVINKGSGSDPKNWSVGCDWTANGYRLPTETEWEFAAGNGEKHTRYSWGDEPPADKKVGNVPDEMVGTKFPGTEIFKGYSDGFVYTSISGSYPPNDFGLYDMTGNVWEWCWDWYDDNYCRANKNKNTPQGPASGTERVLRGGSWLCVPKDCLVNNRFPNNPDTKKTSIGFRLARN
ncbi:MAG TPA: SUMF1/EgtB/PvdO family nonheme iron enzyme [Saprospiraceae bacterium]|nr:SUMF1/EgtB/PvdO family nonheme iron enzyme [Saprospiraceae bacterium]